MPLTSFRFRTAILTSALLGAALLPSCSDDSSDDNSTTPGGDAGSETNDSGSSPGRDAGTDSGKDAGKDASTDAGKDAGETDAGDAGVDSGTPEPTGRWTLGDLHVHTFQSDDCQVSLDTELQNAFVKYGLDWMTLSNHLRSDSRDHTGTTIASGPVPFSKGMAVYEVPFIKDQLAQGKYADKIVFSGFEWDIPTHDHGGIGILGEAPMADAALKAVNQFEYLFSNRDASMFAPADIAEWTKDGQTRQYSTHADSVAAIAWLQSKFTQSSYMAINHPSRGIGKYTIAQVRDMINAGPDVVFAIEGMVGGQMEPDRAGYNTAYIDANLPYRTYGGVDYMVAKLGGVWDALLGEGRHIWNVADSDYHFRIIGSNSSGYAPGEYAKNHVWVDGNDMFAVLKGLKSGKMFGTYGDLIDALDFTVKGPTAKSEMGAELAAKANDDIEVKIRFKSPDHNNFEYPIESGNSTNVRPVVDHVDLIAGDVTGLTTPGTDAYNVPTNASTVVLARFTKNDWTVDADGYNVITFKTKADHSRYFRLRGTNLGTNVAGETVNGEPQPDARTDSAVDAQRFNLINARNYNDLWFYSSPVFVKVAN